jgi:hypothetical protein
MRINNSGSNAGEQIESADQTLSTGPVRRTVHPDISQGSSFFGRRLNQLIAGAGALLAGELMERPQVDLLHEAVGIISVEDDSGELPQTPTEVTNTPSGLSETLTMTAAELVGDQTAEFQNFYTTYSTYEGYQASNLVVA